MAVENPAAAEGWRWSAGGRLRRLLAPGLLALLTFASYLSVLEIRVAHDGSAAPFIVKGTSNSPGNHGYDGQYYYRLAVAPLGGRRSLDNAPYRYQRIGYPLAARLLAIGRADAIPLSLVVVNAAAIAAAVGCIAFLCGSARLVPALAITWALYAGQVASYWRDLAEPMSMAFVAVALILLRRERDVLAAFALLAAALTKELALLFAAALALDYLLRGRARALLTVVLVVALPYAVWQGVLFLTLGATGFAGADHPPALPFGGFWGARNVANQVADVVVVIAPAILCLVFLFGMLWRRRATGGRALWNEATCFPVLALLANIAYVAWLPARSYADLWASARNADGLVLAALAMPSLATGWGRRMLLIMWACSAPFLWLG